MMVKLSLAWARAWAWLQTQNTRRTGIRRLCLVETVSLGDKRFLAIVQIDKLEYLIAVGGTSIALLTPLKQPAPKPVPKKQPAIRRTKSVVTQIRAKA